MKIIYIDTDETKEYSNTYYADEVAKIDSKVLRLATYATKMEFKLHYNSDNLNDCVGELIQKAEEIVPEIDLDVLYKIMWMSFHEHEQMRIDLEIKKEMAKDQIRRVYLLIIKIWAQEGVIKNVESM